MSYPGEAVYLSVLKQYLHNSIDVGAGLLWPATGWRRIEPLCAIDGDAGGLQRELRTINAAFAVLAENILETLFYVSASTEHVIRRHVCDMEEEPYFEAWIAVSQPISLLYGSTTDFVEVCDMIWLDPMVRIQHQPKLIVFQ